MPARSHHVELPTTIVLLLLRAALPAADAAATAPAPAGWENVSAAFTREIGADDCNPGYLRRCIGMVVLPSGDVLMNTSTKGMCVSKDQGATWTPAARIEGRSEHGFSFAIPYPWNGRVAFFAFDGKGGNAGGMSLDGAATWRPFAQPKRGVEFADADWGAHDALTVFGVCHEPYFTVLSHDGGTNWTMLDPERPTGGARRYSIGVVAGDTLVRYLPKADGAAIERSTDAGKTWAAVDTAFHVTGLRPVHYGRTLYWTTSQGVISSADGAAWALTGPGAEGALYGPYFGASEQDAVVVTAAAFLRTSDGGKTWKAIADRPKLPDLFHGNPDYAYLGWDPAHGLLYASGLGASIYRLRL